MVKVNLIKFSSFLGGDVETFEKESEEFLASIFKDEVEIDPSGVPIFFIRTGGSEAFFKETYLNYKPPYYLLAQGERNSLASSLEIASFLKNKGLPYEIIYGDVDLAHERVIALSKAFEARNNLVGKRYGVIGTPSDWLISSNTDYKKAKELFGIEIIDISLDEFYEELKKKEIPVKEEYEELRKKTDREEDLLMSFYIYGAIERIIEKYHLSGFSMRCFDLLGKIHNTSCLSFAYFNSKGIVAACEGDVPSLISMAILNELTHKPIFMANPSRIDVKNKEATYAHCTCPWSMLEDYTLKTHFESGLGFGIAGKFKLEKVTMFKIDSSFNYVIKTGRIIRNLEEENLCRSQIVVSFDQPIDDLVSDPKGNHMLFVYGDESTSLDAFFATR